MISKRLIAYASDSMKFVWKHVFLQWLMLLCNILLILTIAELLDALLHGKPFSYLAVFAIALLAVIVRLCCSLALPSQSFQAAETVKMTLRSDIYKKILTLGSAYQNEISTSEIVQVAVEGVDQLETYFGKYLPQLFYSLLAPLTLFAVLSFISFSSSFVLLLCVPLIPVSIILIQKFAKKLLKRYWGSYTNLGANFLENIQGLTTLKIYQADEMKNIEMNEKAENFRSITMKVLRMQLNSITIMDLIAYGGSVLGIILALSGYHQGYISFAGCFALILLASEFFIPLRLLGSFFHIAMNGMAASDKIFRLLDLPDAKQGNREVTAEDMEVSFQNVSFAYDENRQVLHDISFNIKPGLTGIAGASGSGKSTIARLLTQNLNYQGEILLGGIPLSSYSSDWRSSHLCYVGHNSYLFKGTVRDNLLMGRADACDQMLWHVLDTVNLSGFLKNEKGLETELKEQGSNFSGGQRQRLAFARALLHDSPIYIFDESSSNIDSESEEIINKAILALAKKKTVLAISHRLSSLIPADIIYVLKDGCLEESGTHRQLLNNQGHYEEMFRHQSELENFSTKGYAYAKQ